MHHDNGTVETSQPETIRSLEAEIRLLNRQVEKLAAENVELLKKIAALQVGQRSKAEQHPK